MDGLARDDAKIMRHIRVVARDCLFRAIAPNDGQPEVAMACDGPGIMRQITLSSVFIFAQGDALNKRAGRLVVSGWRLTLIFSLCGQRVGKHRAAIFIRSQSFPFFVVVT